MASTSRSSSSSAAKQADTFESLSTRLLRIHILLAITASMLVFLGVFGWVRRSCGNLALALVAFGAYALSPAIIAYTLGRIQSAPFGNWHFPVWAAYLVVVLGSANSYTAHSIGDIEQWKSFSLRSAATCFMTSWMIALYVTQSMPILCRMFLFVILFMKVDERARALMLASNSVMQKKYMLLADYMMNEHNNGDICPQTMHGCKYLVSSLVFLAIGRRRRSRWENGSAPDHLLNLKETGETDGGVITVEKVWSCNDRLLSGDLGLQRKDLCLSFSLFKFIRMRFAGYSLPQEAHGKLWRLIRHMLAEEDGHKRVFRVIEGEVAFLFDSFYTNYPVNLDSCSSFICLLVHLILVAAPLISSYSYKMELAICSKTGCAGLAFLVTNLLMMSIFVIQCAHFGVMVTSELAKVTYICKYVQNEWWRTDKRAEKLIEVMCRLSLRKPRGRQLRQYSLLEAYSYSSWKCIHNRFTSVYLDPESDGQKEIAPTNLSDEVKKAIALSLKNHAGSLKRGQDSLRHNPEFNGLSWACDLETTTHVIIVWNIATTFCEHRTPTGNQASAEHKDNFCIATELSRYLAYLVAFAPSLLPDDPAMTEHIFSHAVKEARDFFGELVSMEERIEKMRSATEDDRRQQTILGQGMRLGTQLVELANGSENQEQMWNVLANFWAEMTLFVAPSDDIAAHAKCLTTGGEFVTRVWVLVSHAGFTRDPHTAEQNDYQQTGEQNC